MYHHTTLEPVVRFFKPEFIECPDCHEQMERHIVCEGARFHVPWWDSNGIHCSEPNCEYNHRLKHRLEYGNIRR